MSKGSKKCPIRSKFAEILLLSGFCRGTLNIAIFYIKFIADVYYIPQELEIESAFILRLSSFILGSKCVIVSDSIIEHKDKNTWTDIRRADRQIDRQTSFNRCNTKCLYLTYPDGSFSVLPTSA